ncbi:COG3650 family protein [Vibrio hepatarius]|uniref:COG3650 family protein n=1 Tax=Vibrio hepatarius TaxID=171383 RepID=UPI003734CF04
MKALRNPVAIVTLLALQACSISTQPSSESTSTAPAASLDKPATIKPQTFIMRGEVVLGHEVRTITPCGSQQQYWLELPNDRFQQAMSLVRRPYEPLYGEVIGHLETGLTDGFVADYAARFVVDSINILTAENPKRCQQPTNPTRAFGTEPFWSMSFEGNQLAFQKMGEEKQLLELSSSRIESDQRRYQFEGGSLELNQRSCVDNMSDSLYGWSSELELNGVKYQGCATLSNRDGTQGWTGYYQANSTKSSDFSISLQLKHDHTAKTSYSYNNGESDSVETGYWQQLNPEQVQVVMTHHQQQPLLSERLFSRKGEQLTATKEKVGNVIYPIADGGVTLFKNSAEQTLSSQQESPNQIPSSVEFNPKVDKALRNYFASTETDPTGTRYRWLSYDLNGDGNKELITQLDWCGSGGCTLLIFENHQNSWRFNSRITLVSTPINLGVSTNEGWQDMVFFVSGGGAVPNQHILKFDGQQYPLNPSTAPVANYDEISPIQLFSDGLTPHQEGITL